MFGRRRTTSAGPSMLMLWTNRSIVWISSSLVLYRVPRIDSLLWWRDGNRMDSYRVSTVDAPESPISSGARTPWQVQQCNSLLCHEEWWDSVPPSVVIFSWALDVGGAAGTYSSGQLLPSALEVQRSSSFVLNPCNSCIIWQCRIATCVMQSLKIFLCIIILCHFNFDPGTLL